MSNSHTTAAKTAAVFVVLITTFFLSQTALAQVPVVESDPIIRPIGQNPGVTPAQPNGQPSANPMDQLFEEIQSLRQQVREQNGLIEELSFEVRRLQQQQLEDYRDLDRRLSELSQGGALSRPDDQAAPNIGSRSPPPMSGNAVISGSTANSASESADESSVYRATFDLMSAREWDKAIVGLQGYLRDFPGGRYQGNAHYWLGELYLIKEDFQKARDAFELVINEYPDNTRIDVAKYKLGTTYFYLDEKQKARALLEELAVANNDASREAATFLKENY